MKIVSYKRMNRVGSGGRWNWSPAARNYSLAFILKVTAVLLISCTIIAFQVATTLSSKSDSLTSSQSQEDFEKLIGYRESKFQSRDQNHVSICNSCGESEADAAAAAELAAIRQIANEELESTIDSSAGNDNDSVNNNLNLHQSVVVSNSDTIGTNSKIAAGPGPDSEDENLKTIMTTPIEGSSITKESQSSELLDNVFFSVKSTKRFHKTRLEPVLKTWFNLAKEQTWIFTDEDDHELKEKTNGHVINTHCPSTHYRQALCCKMATEFDTFIQTTKSWFCHFDDDNYVNVPALLEMLGKYNSREYWYLGKPSLKSPIVIRDPDNHTEEVSFWFATGGAGFCLSRALALRMSPLASGGKFTKICDRIQLPDDVTVGYIAGHLLGQNLTVIPQFHSHFETMKFIDMKNPSSEITFSYLRYSSDSWNVLEVGGFSPKDDPTRFLSLHCQLFPNFSFCPKTVINNTISTRRRRRR